MKIPHTVIDHITITAPTLEAGAELVEQALGVPLQKGGEHPRMGTHNLFLRLGDAVFLEVIACNPNAKKPDRPRWFALDDVNENTPASLKTWVVRTADIKATVNDCSEPIGEIEPMSRGKANWLFTIPKDGSLPINEGAPALIQWQTESHPATAFIDHGLSLLKLQIIHPEPKRLLAFMESINLKDFEESVEVLQGDTVKMVAYIDTPQGVKELSV